MTEHTALLADRDVERLTHTTDEVRTIAAAQGGRVVCQVLDVANFEQVVALKERAYADFSRVDVLMNNAGTSHWPRTARPRLSTPRPAALAIRRKGRLCFLSAE